MRGSNEPRLVRWNFQRSYIARNLDGDFIFSNFQIITRLEIHPKNWSVLEVARKTQGGVRGDAAPFVENVCDARDGNAQIHRHPVHAQSQRDHELFAQNFSRMHWFDFLCHLTPLMVIHNLDLVSVTLQPHKTNAPLLVNTNAILPLAIALQRFQSVPGSAASVRISGAASSMSSFRRACRSMALNRRTVSRWKSRSESALRKERITGSGYTAVR